MRAESSEVASTGVSAFLSVATTFESRDASVAFSAVEHNSVITNVWHKVINYDAPLLNCIDSLEDYPDIDDDSLLPTFDDITSVRHEPQLSLNLSNELHVVDSDDSDESAFHPTVCMNVTRNFKSLLKNCDDHKTTFDLEREIKLVKTDRSKLSYDTFDRSKIIQFQNDLLNSDGLLDVSSNSLFPIPMSYKSVTVSGSEKSLYQIIFENRKFFQNGKLSILPSVDESTLISNNHIRKGNVIMPIVVNNVSNMPSISSVSEILEELESNFDCKSKLDFYHPNYENTGELMTVSLNAFLSSMKKKYVKRKLLLNMLTLNYAERWPDAVPCCVSNNDYLNYSKDRSKVYLSISSQCSLRGFHIDNGTGTWHHCLAGEKIWYFWIPTSDLLNQWSTKGEGFRNDADFIIRQSAGCTLLVPGGFPHMVATVYDTVAVCGSFMFVPDYKIAFRCISVMIRNGGLFDGTVDAMRDAYMAILNAVCQNQKVTFFEIDFCIQFSCLCAMHKIPLNNYPPFYWRMYSVQ